MSLIVLSVAFPFARVAPDAAGGAEQVLGALDAALVHAGHRSIVVAAADSQVQGRLVATAVPQGMLTDDKRRAAWHWLNSIAGTALDRDNDWSDV